MVYFALTPNQALATNVKGTKKLTHVECGASLRVLDDGQCYCPTCHRYGWPVKRI